MKLKENQVFYPLKLNIYLMECFDAYHANFINFKDNKYGGGSKLYNFGLTAPLIKYFY